MQIPGFCLILYKRTNVVGAQQNCLDKVILKSVQNMIFLKRELKKNILQLSWNMNLIFSFADKKFLRNREIIFLNCMAGIL